MGLRMHNIRWQKWGAVSCLIALLSALGVLSYTAVDQSQRDIAQLAQQDLPLFDDIQELRTALVNIESAIYEYYLTADIELFDIRYRAETLSVKMSMQRLDASIDDPSELAELKRVHAEMQETVAQFRAVMSRDVIEWDRARSVLTEFRPLTSRANDESEMLTARVREQIVSRSDTYAKRMRTSVYLVALMSTIAVLAAAYLARINYDRLKAVQEQERLASFPSSNPHPVLALDRVGRIIYANEAARAASGLSGLMSLLPPDIFSYLIEDENYCEWEFEKDARWFQASLGWLNRYQEYHLYLLDISARKHAEEDLEYLAYHDLTTGLINRQQFNEFVDEHLSDPIESMLLVAIMDMDLLKSVVAAAGVNIAEKVARFAAMRLQHAIADENFSERSCLSYVGGGLFCFAYPNDPIEADIIFQRMRESIARPFDIDGFEFYLHLTIGVVAGEHLIESTSEEALRLADGALNLAKQRGGDQIVMYESKIEEEHRQRMRIEMGLRHAQQDKEFELFYQPKIALSTGVIAGAEALIRWRQGEIYTSPEDFIPVAEDSGQILEIGEWVMRQAVHDMSMWNANRTTPIHVAVNLSVKQLLYSDLAATIAKILKEKGVAFNLLELEITETAALTDFERALERLTELRSLGLKLSLDDFGTGYSSLSYLQRLPVQTLKIDSSFIQELAPGSHNEAIANTVISLAHRLNLDVVAEGVETEAQLNMLRSWRCEYVQGFLLAKPMKLQDFIVYQRQNSVSSALVRASG